MGNQLESPQEKMGNQLESPQEKTMKKVIFYGSLKKGFYNYDRFNSFGKQIFVSDIELPGYDIYSLTHFPAVCEGKGTIKAEIHIMDIEVYRRVFSMEIGSGYVEEMVEVNGESYSLFVMPKCNIEAYRGTLIESGEWREKI